jgi:hypothetical protein
MTDDRLADELASHRSRDAPALWPSAQPRAVSRPDLNDPQITRSQSQPPRDRRPPLLRGAWRGPPSTDADLTARISVARLRRTPSSLSPGTRARLASTASRTRSPTTCSMRHSRWSSSAVCCRRRTVARRRLSYPTRAFITDGAVPSSWVRTTASTRALLAPWPRFGGHGMGRVAKQYQVAGEPAPTVNATDGVDQQVIERRHPLQQVCCGGKYLSPLVVEGREVASRRRLGRLGCMGCSPKVNEIIAERGMAEGSQWGPVLLEPRVSPTPHNRAYVTAR